MNPWLVLLHLLAAVAWIGGMFVMHFCVRPAAQVLEPPHRLRLMHDSLRSFFGYVLVAIVVLWVTGGLLVSGPGLANAPVSWHLMMGIAALMTAIFGWLRWRELPRLTRAIIAGRVPEGAAAMQTMRRLVSINLVLGTATIAVAVLGRYW